jgi:hypothetical protein
MLSGQQRRQPNLVYRNKTSCNLAPEVQFLRADIIPLILREAVQEDCQITAAKGYECAIATSPLPWPSHALLDQPATQICVNQTPFGAERSF